MSTLELTLKREKYLDDRTIGRLTAGNIWQCWTLEDKYREIVGVPVEQWKIKGETAIPMGHYQIKLRDSPRFGKAVPWITDVPGFSWVLIHSGNRPGDTEGCILVGEGFDENTGNIVDSRKARDELYEFIRGWVHDNDEVWITVK